MTKDKMINIIKDKERMLYDDLETWKEEFGPYATSVETRRTRWAVIYELCSELGIEI